MPIGVSLQADVLRMAVIAVAAVVLATLLIALRRWLDARGARPYLPTADRPPAGLGRLLPVGAQVDEECRRGVAALEQWLLSSRPAGGGGS